MSDIIQLLMKKQHIEKLPRYFAITGAILGFFIYSYLEIAAIGRDPSSTAGIALFFLPFTGTFVALVCAIFSYCLGYIIKQRITTSKQFTWRLALAIIIVVPTIIMVIVTTVEVQKTKLMIRDIEVMNNQQLDKTVDQVIANEQGRFQPFLLSAIARNDQASSETLAKIAHIKDARLDISLYRQWESRFDILGSKSWDGRKRRGNAVMRLVASHPNVTAPTLTELSMNTQDSFVLSDIASNPKTPTIVLRKLFQQHNDLINTGLARNPATPMDILTSLSNDNNLYILTIIVKNPNAPQDLRKKIEKRLKACGTT